MNSYAYTGATIPFDWLYNKGVQSGRLSTGIQLGLEGGNAEIRKRHPFLPTK
jgi:hypothetical protein